MFSNMEAIDNLHKVGFYKEMEAETILEWIQERFRESGDSLWREPRNGLINGCHLNLASWPDQLQSYSISPPRFSWQLFSQYPTGHCT